MQLKAKKCTEVAFLGHIVGWICDTVKISTVRTWHAPDLVKQVRQFVGFVGCYHHFIQDLTSEGAVFAWTPERPEAFVTLKSCLLQAPILGFPTEDDRFVLDTDASLFAVGGVLNQLQGDRKVVIAYASLGLRLSQ